MSGQKTVERCAACGREIRAESSFARIERTAGKNKKGNPKQLWGCMHWECFARVAGKPKDILAVLAENEGA